MHIHYLRESTVVPNVALMGKHVVDESRFALLRVLSDRIQRQIRGDLKDNVNEKNQPNEKHGTLCGKDKIHIYIYIRRGRSAEDIIPLHLE